MKKSWLQFLRGVLAVLAGGVLIYTVTERQLIKTAAILEQGRSIVIIDPGHGGEDGGACTNSGVLESGINLEISRRLDQLLNLCGMQTKMIRTEDVSIYTGDCPTLLEKKRSDLKNRVKLVNAIPNAILVSVHQNHFSDDRYHGAQVFYAGTFGSQALAERTQAALRQTLDPKNRRQSKRAESVYLLEQILCPGILVECGFLSNQQEALLLQQDSYQKKIVCAIAQGVAQFTEERKPYGKV